MTGRRVLVTRPQREAQRWVQRLRDQGLDAQALPLLAIEPLQDAAAVRQLQDLRQRASGFDAWMFVSSAAVDHFLAGATAAVSLASGPRCWATGPGTAAALQEAGVPASRIDVPPVEAEQFDSEALWRIVRPQLKPGARVLFVRGGDAQGQAAGRDWLSRQVADAGAGQETAVAYRRVLPTWTAQDQRTALAAAKDGSVWLFSSSQAIANLQALASSDWSRAFALATHPRIALAAREAGFGRVLHSSAQPKAVVASIESFQ